MIFLYSSAFLTAIGVILSFVAVDARKRSESADLASTIFPPIFVFILVAEAAKGNFLAIGAITLILIGTAGMMVVSF